MFRLAWWRANQHEAVFTLVTRHVSLVTCPSSRVPRHVSLITCPSSRVPRHVSLVTCPSSRVPRHVSLVTCPVSRVLHRRSPQRNVGETRHCVASPHALTLHRVKCAEVGAALSVLRHLDVSGVRHWSNDKTTSRLERQGCPMDAMLKLRGRRELTLCSSFLNTNSRQT